MNGQVERSPGPSQSSASGIRARRRRESRRRSAVGIAVNYCAGFMRQQDDQRLGIPLEITARFSPRLGELVCYGVCGCG
jgi:hypothetical protein